MMSQSPQDLSAVKDLILGFLATGISIWVVTELHAMRKSVEALNISLAQILEKFHHIEHRVSKLEDKNAT